MKYSFKVGHLDCANCARKIEERINKESYVDFAELNFMLKKLTVKVNDEALGEEETRERLEKLADAIEKGTRFYSEDDEQYEEDEDETCDEEACRYHEGHEHHHHGEDTHEDHHHEEVQHETHKHQHEEEHSKEDKRAIKHKSEKKLSEQVERIALIVGLIVFAIGLATDIDLLLIIAYICVGYDIIWQAAKNLLRGSVLDENFLMTIATIAAFAIAEYPEAVAVMVFYKIGEFMQSKAVSYSRKEIAKAMDIRPDFARIIKDGNAVIVAPNQVKVGNILEVRPGEKLPLDGVIVKGETLLDTSILTGESALVVAKAGDEILSGCINKEGLIEVKVTKSFKNSTVSKILELIEHATSKKSKSENFITKFAKWYTPIVVLLAILTAVVPSLITGNWHEWIYTSITFLVISCPCAIVVSVPLGFFAGLGAAAQDGVLVKGSNYLEAICTVDTIVLDKTGTITKGKFGVTEVIEAKGNREEILHLAASLEQSSNHPIAKSIVESYKGKIDVAITDVKEVSGQGMMGHLDGKLILVGNDKLMANHGVAIKVANRLGSHIYVAVDKTYLGCIVVADQIKEDSKEAIAKLKANGIKKVVMLTGDKKEIAEEVGRAVGVDEVHAELLPQDKVAELEKYLSQGKVAFVGDGINDAPVLARADVGIAMGGVGSDAAIEASDIVLMTDELSAISRLLKSARRTRIIVTQNIIFALGVKVIVLLLGLIGMANMWLAVFADVGVSLIAVINSIRALGGNLSYIKAMFKNR